METKIIFSSSDKGSFPISFEQERMWLLEQFSPGNSAYNITGNFFLRACHANTTIRFR
ncbi:hypothetical protein [Scytonema sp. NUACC26]|uniref:hypothetical protein n=1 Tax=Scytonema sp. NUACC26 TaxID=3140176 RepID=UPI0038B324DF